MTPPDRMQGNSLARMLNIFELFRADRATIHVEDVEALHDVARSTAYRHLQELCEAGLLAQIGKGVYSLGPRIIELERLLQLGDPLLLAGKKFMQGLETVCVNRAVLLCSLYKDRVLCVHHVGAEKIAVGAQRIPILRGRGTPLPLFQGAGSQAILAHLPPHRLRALFAANGPAIGHAGLGADWPAFRGALAGIRKRGFALSFGQVSAHLVGVAVPILLDARTVLGSLLLLHGDDEDPALRAGLVQTLQERSAQIARAMDAVEK